MTFSISFGMSVDRGESVEAVQSSEAMAVTRSSLGRRRSRWSSRLWRRDSWSCGRCRSSTPRRRGESGCEREVRGSIGVRYSIHNVVLVRREVDLRNIGSSENSGFSEEQVARSL